MALNLNILEKRANTIDKPQNIKYVDLHLDIQPKYTKNLQALKLSEISDIVCDVNAEAIKNSIYNILATMPGQKVLNPEFGLNFDQWLFASISETNCEFIRQKIYNQLSLYEPRIVIDNINVVPDYEQQQYIISLSYNHNQFYTLNLTETGLTNA